MGSVSGLKEKEQSLVLIIEPVSSLRQILSDVVRNLGFNTVIGVATGKEALAVLEVEKISWVLASNVDESTKESPVNAFHILKLITQHPKLRTTAMSLLVDIETELDLVPYGFELGLLSYHPKTYVRDVMVQEFEKLFTHLQQRNWDSTLTAADYLRALLKEKGKLKSLLALEQNLMHLYPGSASVLFHLAEAEFGNMMTESALSALSQVEILDKSMAVHCQRLRKKYLGDDEGGEAFKPRVIEGNQKSVLGINNAVVIDSDTDVLYHVTELLKGVGVKDIETFESGETAFQWLDGHKSEPDLIIMEWKTIGISGPMLIQRIRQIGYLQVPVVVISSLIEPGDSPILREMGVDQCQPKPFEQSDFYASVIWAIQQNRQPTEQKSLELKIRRLLHSGKIEEAKRLMSHLMADERIEDSCKVEIEAEYLFVQGAFQEARDKGIEAIRQGGDSLLMLNLVGKSMLKLGEFDLALKCFEKANTISSLNVERVLNIAQASVEIGDHKKAEEAVERAKTLDPTNKKVKEVECEVRIEVGPAEAAKNLMETMDTGRDIISYMNNRAISLARNGRFEDGIELYKKTLESLPAKWAELRAVVSYNLGLSYARYGDLDLAKGMMDQASVNTLYPISKKAKSLSRRIQKSISSGESLELNEEITKSEVESLPLKKGSPVASISDLVANFQVRRGDIGCFLSFYYLEGDPSVAQGLVIDLPHFQERTAIKKTHPTKRP